MTHFTALLRCSTCGHVWEIDRYVSTQSVVETVRVERCPRCGSREYGPAGRARFAMQRIDHQQLYSTCAGVYTNGAEEFFSRMRRAEIGHHHHVAGPYLVRYAQEAAWREDARRVDNGSQVQHVAKLAMANKPSVDFCGYWQRAQRPA